ncbi:MAG: hypothetical protein IRY99_08655, partial [Isosphaeraceae bacterium]|nr:hypothetical protein [Isosphaeraceae bacterium]
MLYIGTDDGIYRWFPGANWPIFHSLQGRAIVDLASPGGGVIVAVDNTGRVWETTSNGQDWNEVPLPTGAGRPSALALAWTPAEIVMAMRPKGLYRRPVGLVAESPEGPPSRFAWLAGVLFGTPRESGVTATAT